MAEKKEIDQNQQLCFKLYIMSKALTKIHHQLLLPLDLTYPQYMVMLVLWQEQTIDVRSLEKRLHLNANTLLPLLTRLDKKGYIKRKHHQNDAHRSIITLSRQGESLKAVAQSLPKQIRQLVSLSDDDIDVIQHILDRSINHITTYTKQQNK